MNNMNSEKFSNQNERDLLIQVNKYLETKKLSEAELALEFLEAKSTISFEVYICKAKLYFYQKRKPNEILDVSKKAYELNPHDIRSLTILAGAYLLCEYPKYSINLILNSEFAASEELVIQKLLYSAYIAIKDFRSALSVARLIYEQEPKIGNFISISLAYLQTRRWIYILYNSFFALIFISAIIFKSKALFAILYLPILIIFVMGIYSLYNKKIRFGILTIIFASVLSYLLLQMIISM